MSDCQRPDCTGTIVDGFCDTCGMAPKSGSAAATPAPAATSGEPERQSARESARVDVSQLTSRSGPTTTSTGRRTRIGGGVVNITPITAIDPATVVMTDPSIPENSRWCPSCSKPVGRGKDGRPGRQSGFCSNCGTHFDFAAKLQEGDVVANQYEVAGALAHGGLGWIYLAKDRNVSGRWCVLKGLLDSASPDAAEAAVAERRFLAEVSHPAIVEIFNFVQHEAQGYIVMQYVGGPSLKQLATKQRSEDGKPMVPTEAMAYLLAVLPALGYLHERGLVFCDFKPDNVIHVEDSVKLIDMGGVRRIDDPEAAIFGTLGYQAPEVAKTGPTVASDLYTVGRSLAVLILDWPEWQRADQEQLPTRDNHDILVRHDSLWRFLERACNLDPAQRFANADEMADALQGVLCQVAADNDGAPRPYTSERFTPPRTRLDGFDWQTLPLPILPAHPQIPNRVAGLTDGNPGAVITLAAAASGDLSWADTAALAEAHCELGDLVSAASTIERLDVSGSDTPGFVTVPYRSMLEAARSFLLGTVALAAADTERAVQHFEAAYAAAPGESACTYAFAAALEMTGDAPRVAEAARLYNQIAVADPSWVAALAGLSRALAATDNQLDAARVLVKVPSTHPSRAEALTLACQAMRQGGYDEMVATAAVDHLRNRRRAERTTHEAELAVALYGSALDTVVGGGQVGDVLDGAPASDETLAQATELALLDLADATPDMDRRHELLDTAARVRPWSVW